MRVLVVASFPPDRNKSPESEKAFHLCDHLARRGIEVHVVTEEGAAAARRPNVVVHPIMKEWSWLELPRLEQVIREAAPHAFLLVFLSYNFQFHPMVTFLPRIGRQLAPPARFVTLFEDADARPVSLEEDATLADFCAQAELPTEDARYGVLLRDSDRIAAVSQRIADLLAPYGDFRDKCTIIPNPPIIELAPEDGGRTRLETRRRLGVAAEEFLLCFFGYIYPPKDLESLLEALAQVRGAGRHAKLLIVGGTTVVLPDHPYYVEEMVRRTEELRLTPHVLFTGGFAWDSDEPSRFLWASDACVLPFVDGVCVHNCSFAAAAAHGLPVVTTRGPALEEPFLDGQNVLLCPPENPAALRDAILRVIDDAALRATLQAGVRRLGDEYFSWERTAELLCEALGART